MNHCLFVPPTPGYAPCSREKGHDGPCAHELSEISNEPARQEDGTYIYKGRRYSVVASAMLICLDDYPNACFTTAKRTPGEILVVNAPPGEGMLPSIIQFQSHLEMNSDISTMKDRVIETLEKYHQHLESQKV